MPEKSEKETYAKMTLEGSTIVAFNNFFVFKLLGTWSTNDIFIIFSCSFFFKNSGMKLLCSRSFRDKILF